MKKILKLILLSLFGCNVGFACKAADIRVPAEMIANIN